MSWHIFEIQMVLPMAPLHSLGKSDQIEVRHDFQSYASIVPALLSCDTNCIINTTILFIRWRNWNKVWHDFWSLDAAGSIGSTCHWMAPLCLLGQDEWNKMKYDFVGHLMPLLASHDTDHIINSNMAFVSSRGLKYHATWPFSVSFDTVGTGISIM